MFPNDDICNVDAAKQAAQRLFRRYRNRTAAEGGLGSSEVNRLMKATYEAINMPYDPNEHDVSSFISVFDTNNQGSIQLQDLEQMAVKYLCGSEALMKDLALTTKASLPEKREKLEEAKRGQRVGREQERPAKGERQIKKECEKSYKNLKIQIAEQATSNIQRVFSPTLTYKPPSVTSFYSPKRSSFKDSLSSATTESFRSEVNTPRQQLSQEEIIERGRQIFSQSSTEMGITQALAARVLAQTYELFGKRNFQASSEDVRIWMKLCDKNRDGVVEWNDYEYFLMRTFERESQVRRIS